MQNKKSISMRESLTGVPAFGFYRIDEASVSYMLRLTSQLLWSFIEQGDCVALVDVTKADFHSLAQLYRDLRLRYWSARRDSSFCQLAAKDELAVTLASLFPTLNFYLDCKMMGKRNC